MVTSQIPPGGIIGSMAELTYTVAGMHCNHCEDAISTEISKVAGVESVLVDLAST
jgi:copper chaperone CopZ